MIIQKLELRNFRNYTDLSIDLYERLNIFTGDNAQGKTNLLESIVFLSTTRSHRISDEKKMIRYGSEFALLSCIYKSDGSDEKLKAIIHPKGKTLMKNGYPVMKTSDFIGSLNTVVFTPDDLRIFDDSPRERRKLINQELTSVSRSYMNGLSKYQSVLKERNILLKNEHPDDSLLDILDTQLAEAEAMIYRQRKEFTDYLNRWLTKIYARLSGETDEIRICYVTQSDSDDISILKEKRKAVRRRDLEFRVTTTGIHKDDFIFTKDGRNMTECASQGQKRMVMLGFRLALLLFIREKTGRRPVLLLDDVLSELDREKQVRLLDMVAEKYQCVITATEIPECVNGLSYREFHIEDGKVTAIKGD